MSNVPLSPPVVQESVARALAEDVGPGDLSAAAVPAHATGEAVIVAKDTGLLCGQPFATEVFTQLDRGVTVQWLAGEGTPLEEDQEIAVLSGPAAALLTGERTALNFLQTLSGTATAAAKLTEQVAGTGVRIVDTRKTLPGLRTPQKYAVRVGGGHNHRHGLFDGVLLKENHIAWAGSLDAAVAAAREAAPHTARIQVEVEDLAELHQAVTAGVDAVLLDNFALADLRTAVADHSDHCFLEASGNIGPANVREVAETGVHAISSGSLTRDLTSLDLSMRFRASAPA